VAEAPYQCHDTAVDAQIAKLKASGADILFDVTTRIRCDGGPATVDLGWKPVHIIPTVSAIDRGCDAVGESAEC